MFSHSYVRDPLLSPRPVDWRDILRKTCFPCVMPLAATVLPIIFGFVTLYFYLGREDADSDVFFKTSMADQTECCGDNFPRIFDNYSPSYLCNGAKVLESIKELTSNTGCYGVIENFCYMDENYHVNLFITTGFLATVGLLVVWAVCEMSCCPEYPRVGTSDRAELQHSPVYSRL